MRLKLDANFLALLANSKNLLQNICQYIYSQTKATVHYLKAGVIPNAIERLVVVRAFRCQTAFIERIISSVRYLKPFLLLPNTTGQFRQSGHVSWLAARMAAATRQWVAQVGNSWKWKSGAGRSRAERFRHGENIGSCPSGFLVSVCSAKTKNGWKSLSVDFKFFFPTGKTRSYFRC